MSTSQVLQHLYSLDTSSPDFLRCLYCLIRNDEEEQYFSSLQRSELIRLVDFLDETLGVAQITDDVFRRCLHKLRTICSSRAILPSSYTISSDLARAGEDPVAYGGFSDVWEGTYNGSKVCIKHLRVSEQIRQAVEKAFYREAIIWKLLRHPNVVAFIGVTRNPLQLVSEWMPNGTLTEYVSNNLGANKVGLLLDVAEGLNYLHANHTTHGDLKGPNILVDNSGHACLTDFGFASVVRGLSSVLVTEVQGYTARWAAPEVLGTGDRNTQEADVFAFAMVVVEVFTGESPFSEFTAMVAISKIMDGDRPDRPQEPGLTNSIWDMTCACWSQDPAHRPTMSKAVGILRECYRPYVADLLLSNSGSSRPVKMAVKTKNVDCATLPLGFPTAYQRINKIAEELTKRKDGPRGKRFTELLQLCTRWHTVPASYGLGVVMKQGDNAKRVSRVTEVWKGMHESEVVALKVLKLSQDDPDVQMAQQRFCAGALVMRQIEHDKILPFYGVSTTISGFSLVFPWYESGNIEHYLERNTGANRYNLLLGAVEGLLFLHSNGMVHGALRPSHILIDDDGNARLSLAAHDTSGVSHARPWSVEDTKDCSYMAPETWSPSKPTTPDAIMGTSPTVGGGSATMESDIYEMAIVVHKILTEVAPHCEYRESRSSFLGTGGVPVREHGVIDDLVWGLLEKCWRITPQERPPVVEVYRTLQSRPRAVHTPQRRSAIGELPETLKLHVHGIKFSEDWSSRQQFYVKFKYGNTDYTTSLMDLTNDWGEYTWNSPENWKIETDERYRGQMVSLEVFTRTRTGPLKKDKVYATGDFSLTNSANKQIVVVLGETYSKIVNVKILMIAV